MVSPLRTEKGSPAEEDVSVDSQAREETFLHEEPHKQRAFYHPVRSSLAMTTA